MATPINMLRLSKQMEVGTVVTWLKSIGDPVREGEAVVEVETEKSVVELEAPADGLLLEVAVVEGDEAPVGAVLGWIGRDGETLPTTDAPSGPTGAAASPIPAPGPGKVRASPAIRRLAAARGIDLQALPGSGPGGRITKADVDEAAPVEETERIPLKGIRRAMSTRMARSARTTAPVTSVMDVDMGAIAELRADQAITYTSAVVDNAPATSDIIRVVGGTSVVSTFTFSRPVTDPVMAILSMGNSGANVTYNFDAPFDILSNDRGYWGNGPLTELTGDVLRGAEGHGTIQFQGTFSTISWTMPVAENWHGFTVAVIPEPATLAFCALGVLLTARQRR